MVEFAEEPKTGGDALERAMGRARTQQGPTLLELQRDRPTLVVFLRHAGCPFCREALADVASQRRGVNARGVGLVLVCQWAPGEADALFERAGVGDVPRIHDPERSLYKEFGVSRGNLWRIGHPWVWWRVIEARLAGHRVGKVVGDAFQMPGAVLVHGGRVLHRHRYRSQASRPDYGQLASRSGAGR